jgi:hypothetical protein
MILKCLIADSRTDQAHRNLGDGHWAPAVDLLIAGFDRIEYGGPVYCDPDRVLMDADSDMSDADFKDAHRWAVFAELTKFVPNDPHGWRSSVNALGRDGMFDAWPEIHVEVGGRTVDANKQFGAWWAKLYYDDDRTVTVIHDARAFLMGDDGQTVERLGPRGD